MRRGEAAQEREKTSFNLQKKETTPLTALIFYSLSDVYSPCESQKRSTLALSEWWVDLATPTWPCTCDHHCCCARLPNLGLRCDLSQRRERDAVGLNRQVASPAWENVLALTHALSLTGYTLTINKVPATLLIYLSCAEGSAPMDAMPLFVFAAPGGIIAHTPERERKRTANIEIGCCMCVLLLLRRCDYVEPGRHAGIMCLLNRGQFYISRHHQQQHQ